MCEDSFRHFVLFSVEGWSAELSIPVYSRPYKFLFVIILCMLTCLVPCHKNKVIMPGGLEKICKVWHLGTQFSDGFGSSGLTVGPDDLKSLFQPK